MDSYLFDGTGAVVTGGGYPTEHHRAPMRDGAGCRTPV